VESDVFGGVNFELVLITDSDGSQVVEFTIVIQICFVAKEDELGFVKLFSDIHAFQGSKVSLSPSCNFSFETSTVIDWDFGKGFLQIQVIVCLEVYKGETRGSKTIASDVGPLAPFLLRDILLEESAVFLLRGVYFDEVGTSCQLISFQVFFRYLFNGLGEDCIQIFGLLTPIRYEYHEVVAISHVLLRVGLLEVKSKHTRGEQYY